MPSNDLIEVTTYEVKECKIITQIVTSSTVQGKTYTKKLSVFSLVDKTALVGIQNVNGEEFTIRIDRLQALEVIKRLENFVTVAEMIEEREV